MTEAQFLEKRKSLDTSYIDKIKNLKEKFLKTAQPYKILQVVELDLSKIELAVKGVIHSRFLITDMRVLTMRDDYTNLNIVFDGYFLDSDDIKVLKFTVSYSKNKNSIKLSSNQNHKNNPNVN